MSYPEYAEGSWVMVRYPLTPEQEQGDRASWPWLPGWIYARVGDDEWEVVIQMEELGRQDDDGAMLYPSVFRSAEEIQPSLGYPPGTGSE